MLWSYATGGEIHSSPVLGPDLVYVASMSGVLVAIDQDTGVEQWRIDVGAPLSGSPVLVGGRIYVGSDNGNLYAYGSP